MFASRSILEHLGRGTVGLGALGAAVTVPLHPGLALAFVGVGLVALRGCPMCWTVGLVQTVAARLCGQSASGLCTDGSCGLQRPR